MWAILSDSRAPAQSAKRHKTNDAQFSQALQEPRKDPCAAWRVLCLTLPGATWPNG